jgi:predicted SnoaL-like aldol condensation-catalyzing enzyme
MAKQLDNKSAAVQFLKLVIARKIDEAYKKYVDMKGKHHNLFFPQGFPALQKAMKESHAKFPDTKMTINHIIGDGDLVMVHSHVVHAPNQAGVIAIHLFRFKKGKIVEMWDCGQEIPMNLVNKDGAF